MANHTAGIDPSLIQAACPFFIRYMMAADMQLASMAEYWAWLDVIAVDRSGSDTRSARTAISHVKAGGVVGIFAEGRIERPARVLQPFEPGVGLIVRRTGAAVLPVVIEETPLAKDAWGSFLKRSRARVRFLEPLQYDADASAEAITTDLQQQFVETTGWPVAHTESS